MQSASPPGLAQEASPGAVTLNYSVLVHIAHPKESSVSTGDNEERCALAPHPLGHGHDHCPCCCSQWGQLTGSRLSPFLEGLDETTLEAAGRAMAAGRTMAAAGMASVLRQRRSKPRPQPPFVVRLLEKILFFKSLFIVPDYGVLSSAENCSGRAYIVVKHALHVLTDVWSLRDKGNKGGIRSHDDQAFPPDPRLRGEQNKSNHRKACRFVWHLLELTFNLGVNTWPHRTACN